LQDSGNPSHAFVQYVIMYCEISAYRSVMQIHRSEHGLYAAFITC